MNVNNINIAGHVANQEQIPDLPLNEANPIVRVVNREIGLQRSPRVLVGLDLICEEQMRDIVQMVSPNDRLRLATVLRRPHDVSYLNGVVEQSLPNARLTVSAAEAATQADFQRILAATALHASGNQNQAETYGRAETISALARRILVLPLRHQIGTIEALREGLDGPAGLGHTVNLSALQEAVRANLQAVLPNENEIADAGLNITQLAAFLGVDDHELIHQLQMDTVGNSTQPESARVAAESGRPIAQIAAEFGITHREPIVLLQGVAVRSNHPQSARAAVSSGEPVRNVAARFDIDHPGYIYELERLQIDSQEMGSAGFAARNSNQNVQELILNFGITTPNGIKRLQVVAAESTTGESAGAQVRAGGNAANLAAVFGIYHPSAIYQLEMQQINNGRTNSAGFAVSRGANVVTQADLHGIVSKLGRFSLEVESFSRFAIPAVKDGRDVQAVIEQCGIVNENLIRSLNAAVYT